ncbi:protein RIK isoform X2 [Phalaenopsis equestris]|uniref:protein RIK isoform X2 n=1 Tax=Phalaenopsis equestris TaxID=78828 RepID=UPI0009E564F3|nr:protein RIK isoform X2 [Phalaenopsis equestris]
MTEDAGTKPAEDSVSAASTMRQRKKRRWDEPADFLVSSGISIPGTIPIGFGNTIGITAPGVFPLSNAIAANTVVPLIAQSAATLVQKLSQPKVQDELIAREITINDAEPTIRYKLTKRQTQEEIQRSTGAIVITRGKYRPPNTLPDGEKPLYLHISAGSHLKDMAERIIAVDHAASMVEEILRQGHNLLSTSGPHAAFSSAGQVNLPLSTCLFLGFDPDPFINISARIRGPNDQYINHIINETGATVELRGIGSANQDNSHAEDSLQPLHLFLSSTNTKSLEAARSLAENLLDTIAAECGASRVSSSKALNAVPPPQQLLAGVVSSANTEVSANLVVSTLVVPSESTVLPSGVLMQNGNLSSCGASIPNTGGYVYPTATGGTCYSGYGGIYPQATPLQQVALALKQAPVSTISVVASTNSHANVLPKMTSNSNVDTEKRRRPKRKFQELPVVPKGLPTLNQVFSLTFSEADRLSWNLAFMFHRKPQFSSYQMCAVGCLFITTFSQDILTHEIFCIYSPSYAFTVNLPNCILSLLSNFPPESSHSVLAWLEIF